MSSVVYGYNLSARTNYLVLYASIPVTAPNESRATPFCASLFASRRTNWSKNDYSVSVRRADAVMHVAVRKTYLGHIQNDLPQLKPLFLVKRLMHGSLWPSQRGAEGLVNSLDHDSLDIIGSCTSTSDCVAAEFAKF